MLPKKIFFFFVLIYLICACSSPQKTKFAVAANLLFPMQEVQKAYEEHSGKSFDLISGSSGVLSAQIQHGAPFDLFLSADMKYPQALFDKGLGTSSPEVVVYGTWVFWTKIDPQQRDLEALLNSGEIDRLAIAHPDLAPYGTAAKEWLIDKGLWNSWEKRLVLGENIGQVNQYIRIGSVDAVCTAISAKYAPQLQGKGYWLLPEQDQAPKIPHGALIVSKTNPEAKEILQFLKSETAQALFAKYGYHSM